MPFNVGGPEIIILAILAAPIVLAVVLVRRQHALTGDEPAPNVRFAGVGRRWLASLIDSLIVSIGVGVFLFVLLVTTGVDLFGGSQGLVFLVGAFYGAAMESSSEQATLGKMVLNIRVTDTQGRRVSFGRALGRNLSKWVSALILGIGYLMALFSRKSQALHDMMSGCLVTLPLTHRGTIGTLMGALDEAGPRS